MSALLNALLSALRETQLDLSAEDVADAIWLARRLRPSAPEPAAPEPEAPAPKPSKAPPVAEEPPEPKTPAPRSPAPRPEPAPVPEARRRGEIFLPDSASGGDAGAEGGRPVRVPTGAALPGSLLLARALRPLKKQVPSARVKVFDIERTVRRVAEEGLWIPAVRPARERWLDLSLVVDTGSSMGLWRPLAEELHRLLACAGGFRTVRLWSLDTEAKPPRLTAGLGRSSARSGAREPGELVDPGGRSLVLVLTDCVSIGWHDGSVAKVLECWSTRGPAALVQVLPEHVWSRTALGTATAYRVSAPVAATPNASLRARPLSDWPEFQEKPGSPMPVVSLEPGPLAGWAALVAGAGEATAAGFVFDREPPPTPAVSRQPVPAVTRVSSFWQVASPTARRLAGLLAAAPALSLPVVRLVRQSLLPEARQVHEAEVMLGGLLRVVARRDEAVNHPDEVRYDFHEGVRSLLLDALPTNHALEVLERVSTYVDEHLGEGCDFRALLADPASARGAIRPAEGPFARVAAEVLMRLGGDYARIVARSGKPGFNEGAKAARNATGQARPGSRSASVEPEPAPPSGPGRELLCLRGHVAGASAAAISPDLDELLHGVAQSGSAGVTSVAVSPDGRRIVSGSLDHSARVWDAQSGRPLVVLRGHEDSVWCVAFDHDGRRIVSGSADRTMRLWDASSGRELATFRGFESSVSSVAFDHEGRRIVSGSANRSVRILDAEKQRELVSLRGHKDSVWCVAFDREGRRVVSGSADRTVRVWDAESGRSLAELHGHKKAVWGVAFDRDGRRIVSGSLDGLVLVWDVESERPLVTLRGHKGSVWCVAFDPDGRRVVSGSADRTLRVRDAATGMHLATLHGHKDAVWSVSFDPEGRRIVSGSADGTVRVWDADSDRGLVTPDSRVGPAVPAEPLPAGTQATPGYLPVSSEMPSDRPAHQLSCLMGHIGPVRSVAFSPDGRRIASGSDDFIVRVWDAATGREVLALRNHGGGVSSVAFSPDGRRIVSGSNDGTVRVWDADSGAELACLRGLTGWIHSVAISPDGQRIVSGSVDNTVRVWDTRSGAELACLRGHSLPVLSVATFADGRHIVSGSEDATVRVWDAESGAELACLRGHTHRVSSVATSPDGRRIVSGSTDKTVRIWDAQTGAELACLLGHTDRVISVAFSSDGRRIVSGSWDGTVRIWDAESGRELISLLGHESRVYSVAFDKDGRRVVSGSHDLTVRVWSIPLVTASHSQVNASNVNNLALFPDERPIASGSDDPTVRDRDAAADAALACLRGHTGVVWCVATSPDGRRIVSGGDQTVRVWDIESGAELHTLWGHTAGVNSVAASPDGRRIVSGGDQTVRVWDAASGAKLACLRGHTGRVNSVVMSPDGRRIVSGSDDQTVRIWDANTRSELACLRGKYAGSVNSVAISPDGRRIVSGSSDWTVRVWDANTRSELACLRGHSGGVRSVATSPDGKLIVSGSDDTTVRVWDADSGAELACLRGHTDVVWSVATSPDGQLIVSGSDDATVRVWDAATGVQLACLRGHASGVYSVAMSAEGRRIVSGSDDQTVRLWDADSSRAVAKTVSDAKPVFSLTLDHEGRHISSTASDSSELVGDIARDEAAPFQRHAGAVNCVAIFPDERRVSSGSSDQTVRVWDAKTGAELLCLRGHTDVVWSVATSPDGRRIVSGSRDATVRVWDPESGAERTCLRGHTHEVWSVATFPDGRRIVSGSYDQTVRIWDADSGAERACLRGHTRVVSSVATFPDGRRIVSGSYDQTVRIWDAESGTERACLRGHTGGVNSVAASPDGRRIVSGSDDATVRVWDAESGAELACLRGHTGGVNSVATSPDGRRIVSGSWDATVRVWDVDSGTELGRLQGHTHGVRSVAMSPDGRRILSGSTDGTVRIWNAPEPPAAVAPPPPVIGKIEPRPPAAPLRKAAGAESLQAKLGRVRRPRVKITYDVEVGAAVERKELPFVIGVLADLSGHPTDRQKPLRERRFVGIDRDNLQNVMKALGPELRFRVPNRLDDDGSQFAIELQFESMDDFGPEGVARQFPPLMLLLEDRERIAALDPSVSASASGLEAFREQLGAIDAKLSAQLAEVLHHPEFQRLEATWRGLHYLVQNVETGPTLKIRVLDASKRELASDLDRAMEFDQSRLFRRVYEEEFGTYGGEPYGLLMGDYAFSHRPDDLELLRGLSNIAASAYAPFIAEASPELFGMDRFTELVQPRDLWKIFEVVEYEGWRNFRESEDSRYIGLTLPRILLRLPYGSDTWPIKSFHFEEGVDGSNHDHYLWGSAAWAYAVRVADAFSLHGWPARIRGVEGGGVVRDLPVHTFTSDLGDVVAKSPTEVPVSNRRETELTNLGFLSLVHAKNTDYAAFFSSASCQKPPRSDNEAATAVAWSAAQLDVTLCVSRFVQYLSILARDRIGSFMERDALEQWLNRWLSEYVNTNPDASADERSRYPLREAKLEVKNVRGRPGAYRAVLQIWPYFQLEHRSSALRVEFSLPTATL